MKISHKNVGKLAPGEDDAGLVRIEFRSVTTHTKTGEVVILNKPSIIEHYLHRGECGGNMMMILAKVYVEDGGYFFLWWMRHPNRMKAYHKRLEMWLKEYGNPDPETVLEIRSLSIKIHRKHHRSKKK
jgi:hypothetical protein